MQHLKRLSLFLVALYTLISCQSQETQHNDEYDIEWDESSLVCIADEGAYPRLRRLSNNSLLVVYENRKGDVLVKTSIDEGVSWSEAVIAWEAFEQTGSETMTATRINIANPELIQLPNGDILLASNLRPRKEGVYPFSIALKRSSDNGVTWSDAEILYRAGTIFKDGCWEPSFLLLPDGTLQIYFANESPYRQSDEQEISMLSSTDNGKSWQEEHTTVSFRKGYRDGMPVAVHDGKEIYVTIEDNLSGQFKPYIVKSAVQDAWREPVLQESPNRYPALRHLLSDSVYAGAPYLIRTDHNLYLLSYQTTNNRTSYWEHSTMEVVISDQPNNFINPSLPFNVPLSKEAKW
ncbi:MAG: exo-alpha-sialidase, partial [Proteiniphilum sp.]|nr:exo-alpha-sialidase [Proteiniphilum sp.]